MKAILEFNLEDQFDKEEFNDCVKASRYKSIIIEFDNMLRSKIKYTEETPESYEQIREALNEIINDHEVDL